MHDSWSCDQVGCDRLHEKLKNPYIYAAQNRREISEKNSILIVSGQVAKARSQDRLTLHSLKKVGCDRYSCSELLNQDTCILTSALAVNGLVFANCENISGQVGCD